MSKRRYWKCVDCNSEIQGPVYQKWSHISPYAEYCGGCSSYKTEVVLAYD